MSLWKYRLSVVLVLGAILAGLISSSAYAQSYDTSHWKIMGKVLDTTGQFSQDAAKAFSDASYESGYPMYLLVLEEQLFEGNMLEAAEIIEAIFNGDYGAEFRWKGSGFFPEEQIVVVAAPFIQKPWGDNIPQESPWVRSATQLSLSERYQPLFDAQLMYDDQATWAVDAIATRIDKGLVMTGKFNSPDVSFAVTEIAKALRGIGIYPQGQSAPSVPTAQAPVATQPQAPQAPTQQGQQAQPQVSERNDDIGIGWILLVLVLVLLFVTLCVWAYMFLVRRWIARAKAVSLAESAAHLCASWTQIMQETREAVAAATNTLSPADMQRLTDTIAEADQLASSPQERYTQLRRSATIQDIGKWYLAPEMYHVMAKEIQEKLLDDLEQAQKMLKSVDAEILRIKDFAERAKDAVTQAGTAVDAALTAVQASTDAGFPAATIEGDANTAYGSYQDAAMQLASRQYQDALELAQEALSGAENASRDIAAWQTRVAGLPQEVQAAVNRLAELRGNLPGLLQTIADFRERYAYASWDEVEHHPGAIERLLDELDSQAQEVQAELANKEFDAVVTALRNLNAGIQKVDSLARSITERAEDLEDLRAALPDQLETTQRIVDAAVEYIFEYSHWIAADTEDFIRKAADFLNQARGLLSQALPDLDEVSRLRASAEAVITDKLPQAKREVENMQTLRRKAESLLSTVVPTLSRLHNFLEDHPDVGRAARAMAQAAQEAHTRAMALWTLTETMSDGQEAERMRNYREIVDDAVFAEDKARQALAQAKSDVAPPEPAWTPSYGGSNGGGGSYDLPSMPSFPVHRPAPTSRPSSPMRTSSTPRSYSAPSSPMRTAGATRSATPPMRTGGARR